MTDFLEGLVGEHIEAHRRHHAMVGAPPSNPLRVDAGWPLLHRAATLQGGTSGRSYVYAESVIVTGRLPAWFGPRLESGRDPIGRILGEAGLAVTRHDMHGAVGAHVAGPRADRPAAGDCLLARTYRMDVEQTPVMVITEWFLTSLGPFLEGLIEEVDGAADPGRRPRTRHQG